MWNLTGDDIQRAKEELKGRRAAIKAHYDNEMKQLEADIAAIETFERAAVNFVSSFKGEDGLSEPVADPGSAPEEVAGASASEQTRATSVATPVEKASEQTSSSSLALPVEGSAEPEPAPGPEPVAAAKGSSRWRMRLGATEGSR